MRDSDTERRAYRTACERLLNHASLSSDPVAAPDEESWLYQLGRAGRERSFSPAVTAAGEDVLSCLEVINRALNGPFPSAARADQSRDQIGRRLAYAMQVLQSAGSKTALVWRARGTFAEPVLAELARLNWRIACAGEAVLAGDIDSSAEHVAQESPD